MDSFSRTEEVSWFSRIIESIKGVLIGLLLFLISVPLLFWNEGRAVERARRIPGDSVEPRPRRRARKSVRHAAALM